ncbi:uncharacterized protein RJT21DRAFT_58859 [Scheffersomyces amazonensis]|uniref:uncharacterized protein n=1 Tax=Scheffersomyces amazonensis TaxID=1078765 RepID=UPI00315C7EB8
MSEDNRNNTNPNSHAERFLLILLAIVLPPLPIFIIKKYSIWNKEFLVSVLLTIFGHVPGAVFSIYYILVEFPRSSLQTGEYVRLPDDEERNITESTTNANPTANDPAAPSFGEASFPPDNDAEHHYEANEGSSIPPPSYDDVASASTSSYPVDSKQNLDNKVQH